MGDGHEMIDEAAADMFGLRSALDGGFMFCGVTEEQFAIGGVTYRWPKGSHLRWGIGFSSLGGLSLEQVRVAVTEALAEISACCDVTHEYVTNQMQANIWITSRRLDGGGGVLADCQIPVGNVSTAGTQLLMRLDDSEVWGLFDSPVPAGRIDLQRVILHEMLHGHGLGHKPANINEPALIAPMYDRNMRHLQAADRAELVRRYGPPKNQPIAPAAPTVPPGVKPNVEVAVTIGGEKWIAAGTLKRA